jgi:serine/threonine-protein kinase
MKLMRDLVGTTLSERYRLVTRLAGGGMGEVYRAHDLLLDRPVAVKVLQSSLAADPGLVERFKAEARAAARLAHPNVVSVFDWGAEDDHTYYMVMEYVAGSDLRDLLVARAALEPAQAVEIMISVCDALAAAHDRGLVHRDVKPENVLISRDGTVKVADFGIAVVVDLDRTEPGGVPGTLRYLSPEQAQGYEAGPASDVWAAGAVLAELITGRPPLQGAGAELLRRRASEAPLPPSGVDPSIPPELDEIVLTACALDPLDRFASASDMAQALRRVAVRSLPDAPPVTTLLNEVTGVIRLPDMEPTDFSPDTHRRARRRRQKRVRLLKAIGVLLVVLLVAFGGYRGAMAFFAPRLVSVPDLVGLTRAEARQRALEMNLGIQVTKRMRTQEAPAGRVVAQAPDSGRIQEEELIGVVVSAGPPLVKVPQLTGMETGAASARLRSRGLERGEVIRRYASEPEGVVVGQYPAAGELEMGDRVKLVVSRGPQPVEVPTVTGMDADQAAAELRDDGFTVTRTRIYSDDVPEGRVVSVSPTEGSMVPAGEAIELSVSVGPEFAEVEMPDVRSTPAKEARRVLEGLGLHVRVVDSCGQGDMVVETDPIAGTTIRENDQVALFLC